MAIQVKTLRELDALVAEKIYGQTVGPCNAAWTWRDWAMSDRPTEENTVAIVYEPFNIVIPAYSDDIDEAWSIIDLFHSAEVIKQDDYYRAYLAERGKQRGAGVGVGNSAPVAICLAALRAKGCSVETEFN
jgi:hypothetical protein